MTLGAAVFCFDRKGFPERQHADWFVALCSNSLFVQMEAGRELSPEHKLQVMEVSWFLNSADFKSEMFHL